MRYVVALLLLALAFFVAGFFGQTAQAPTEEVQYSIASLDIADTPAERAQGLSGREVPQDYGLLFVFPEDGIYGFWMKDMLVPIDMVWLSEEFVIVDIDAGVSPDTYPETFESSVSVRYVLEVAAGEAVRKGWDIGTKLSLPL